MKNFTDKWDVDRRGSFPHLWAEKGELVCRPLAHHRNGLQYTRSGYGSRIPTPFMIKFEGRLCRLYCTQYSNCGTVWFQRFGERIIVG